MEHLLTPDASRQINVPYVGTEEFEADYYYSPHGVVANFRGCWGRKGWKRHPATGDLIFNNRSPKEIANSFQMLLYFGCFIFVFRSVGITVRIGDFLDGSSSRGEKFVRTTRLHGFIAGWTRREGFADGTGIQNFESPKYSRGVNIMEMLNWTSLYLKSYCQKSQDMAEPHKSCMNLIELSIMAMGESLCSTLVAIYGYEAQKMPVWAPSPVLEARLRENGWCVSDSPFFPESMTRAAINVDYYFGGSVCPRRREDHSTCTVTICDEYLKVVLPENYKQKHVSSVCPCEPVNAPPAVIDLVARGAIPVIQWDGSALSVSEVTPQTTYVALSHVWSDGLGNDDKVNSLPACQLSRIQSLVNGLYAETHLSSNYERTPGTSYQDRLIPFWIDTLCVPVWGDYARLRAAAIRQMAEIYRRADRVLVLDSFILTLPRSADIVEKYVRIHLSPWHHRLWTLQEGQLARRLFFQLKDGAESFYDMNHAELQSFNHQDPSNLCSPVRLLCARELEAFYRYFEADATVRSDITARMQSCAKYLRSRQTSRFKDEPVCVATILGLDPGPLLAHEDPIERMASFYDTIGRFDPRIIFHRHPRLLREGYRWAPHSFLHQVPDLIATREVGAEELPPTLLIPGGGGLPVRFGDFEMYNVGTLRPGSSVFVRPWTGSYFEPQQQWSWAARTPWWMCTYKLEVPPDVDGGWLHTRGSDVRYAVVLPGNLHPDFLPGPGVLGIIDSGTSANRLIPSVTPFTTNGRPGVQLPAYSVPHRIPMQYVCRVHVSMPAPETVPRGALFVWAIAFSRV